MFLSSPSLLGEKRKKQFSGTEQQILQWDQNRERTVLLISTPNPKCLYIEEQRGLCACYWFKVTECDQLDIQEHSESPGEALYFSRTASSPTMVEWRGKRDLPDRMCQDRRNEGRLSRYITIQRLRPYTPHFGTTQHLVEFKQNLADMSSLP